MELNSSSQYDSAVETRSDRTSAPTARSASPIGAVSSAVKTKKSRRPISSTIANEAISLPQEAPILYPNLLPQGVTIPTRLWECVYSILRENYLKNDDEWMNIQSVQIEHSRRTGKSLSGDYLRKVCGIRSYKQFFIDNPWTDYKITKENIMFVKLTHPSLRSKSSVLCDVKPHYYPRKHALESGCSNELMRSEEELELTEPPSAILDEIMSPLLESAAGGGDEEEESIWEKRERIVKEIIEYVHRWSDGIAVANLTNIYAVENPKSGISLKNYTQVLRILQRSAADRVTVYRDEDGVWFAKPFIRDLSAGQDAENNNRVPRAEAAGGTSAIGVDTIRQRPMSQNSNQTEPKRKKVDLNALKSLLGRKLSMYDESPARKMEAVKREQAIEELSKSLYQILSVNTNGIRLRNLSVIYQAVMEKPLPLEETGFTSVCAFVCSRPDLFVVKETTEDVYICAK